jgi:hypothetical protein
MRTPATILLKKAKENIMMVTMASATIGYLEVPE